MSRRAKKNAARAVLGAVLLAMALFALLPFVYMGLVSLTQKTVLDLRFDPAEFSFNPLTPTRSMGSATGAGLFCTSSILFLYPTA